jgi:hypothetical protein
MSNFYCLPGRAGGFPDLVKNHGDHFEHNFGHDNQYLGTVLMHLMVPGFPSDPSLQRCCRLFQAALDGGQEQDPTVAQAAQPLRSVPPDPRLGGAPSIHHRAAPATLAALHLLAERRERPCSKPLLRITKSQPFQQRPGGESRAMPAHSLRASAPVTMDSGRTRRDLL